MIGVVSDTGVHVNRSGLFRKLNNSRCQAKTVMSGEHAGGSLFATNASGRDVHFSVLRTGGKHEWKSPVSRVYGHVSLALLS